MRDSACRLKKLKHFEVLLNIFEFSLVWEYVELGGLVTRNISTFFLKRVALYFKAMPNLIDFYKGIYLHVVPVHIIVPCSQEVHITRGFVIFSRVTERDQTLELPWFLYY